MTAAPLDPPTDQLARARATHRVVTAPLPRLRALCGREVPGGLCHLTARHADRCLPPPPMIVRPHEWSQL